MLVGFGAEPRDQLLGGTRRELTVASRRDGLTHQSSISRGVDGRCIEETVASTQKIDARAVLTAASRDGRTVLTVSTAKRLLQQRGVPEHDLEWVARETLDALELDGILRVVRKSPAANSAQIESWPRGGRERRGWVNVAASASLRAEIAARRGRAHASAAVGICADLRRQAERIILERHQREVDAEIARLSAASSRQHAG